MRIAGDEIYEAAVAARERAASMKPTDPDQAAELYRASDLMFEQARWMRAEANRRAGERMRKYATPKTHIPQPKSNVQKLREDDARMLDWIRNVS